LRAPPVAPERHVVPAPVSGAVTAIDNRRLSRIAKLAGAPLAPAAGVDLHVVLGSTVEKNQPLYTVHAQSRGELQYAIDYALAQHDVIAVEAAP
jgi:thymidine phosphorylase